VWIRGVWYGCTGRGTGEGIRARVRVRGTGYGCGIRVCGTGVWYGVGIRGVYGTGVGYEVSEVRGTRYTGEWGTGYGVRDRYG